MSWWYLDVGQCLVGNWMLVNVWEVAQACKTISLSPAKQFKANVLPFQL